MSTLLTAHALHVETAFGPLFNSLSFTLKKGDRIGLIGHNGCGKSTLLQVLDGTLAPTSGSVSLAGQCLMARVEQHLPEALHTQSLLQAVLAPLPADAREAQRWLAERLLAQMGFTPAVMEQQTATLVAASTRLLLARALIRQPDLLLLDEPGNHLDLPTLLWLESFLQTAGALYWCHTTTPYWMLQLMRVGSSVTSTLLRLACSAAVRHCRSRMKAPRYVIRRSKKRSTGSAPAPGGWPPGVGSMTMKISPAKPNRWRSRSPA
ncbi:optrA_5_KT862783 [Klebsiella pneumoniae]|nr:optrA_5_KT862783 [Klebsiella pneumoniae]